MKSKFVIGGVTLSSLAAAIVLNGTAMAWHPQGTITKSVKDISANGTFQQASSDSSAVPVKPGDILDYQIVVSNTADQAANNQNDMADTVLTDNLPDGVVFISSSSDRQISENLGTIQPGQKVTKDFIVKVTASTDGEIIINKACFTGNSIVNDNAQSGCAIAEVKVNNPAPSSKPAPAPAQPSNPTATPPAPSPAPAATITPKVIPNTGPGSDALILGGISVITGYTYMLRLKHRSGV